MFSFTCSFVNQNIFEWNKKFNSRTLVQLPEHAGFALLRCQPRGSCWGSSKIPPCRGRGKLLQASWIHLWDLWDHKALCEGTGNGISFPTSVEEFHHQLLQFLLITVAMSLPSPDGQSPACCFPVLILVCCRDQECTGHPKIISCGLPKRGICGRYTGEHSRHDGAKLQEQQNPSWSIFL